MNNHFPPIYTGPKLEEVAIFWQMVMEHKPTVVIMLTNVEENGKVWMVYESLQLTNIYKMQPFCILLYATIWTLPTSSYLIIDVCNM